MGKTQKANSLYRDRKHFILLYPDNEAHAKALEIIKQTYDYCAILHDRDYFTEDDQKKNPEHVAGTFKKKHYHVVIRTTNAVWNSALSERLGIELKFIEQIQKLDNALLYLLHYNDIDKASYPIEETFGSLKTKLKQVINSNEKTEGEKVTELISYIKNYEGILTITDFALYCASNGYWAEFRRSGAIICKIIDEKNRFICK